MDTCKEIDGPNDMLIWEDLLNLDCTYVSYEDLQSRYSALHTTYLKEIENSQKVKKSLEKCLKLYARLCKKFEAQQKIIDNLEKNINEKMCCLEESYKNQEKLKGLIDIYKTERSLYSGDSNLDLKRDKEVLLDICCQLIFESVKTNNIKNITNLILRKFKKDLSSEKLNLLKSRHLTVKKELAKAKGFSSNPFEDVKPFNNPNNIVNKVDDECEAIEKFKEEEDSRSSCVTDQNESVTFKLISHETAKEESNVDEFLSKIGCVNSNNGEATADAGSECSRDKYSFSIEELNGKEKNDELHLRNEHMDYCLPVIDDSIIVPEIPEIEKTTLGKQIRGCNIECSLTPNGSDNLLPSECDTSHLETNSSCLEYKDKQNKSCSYENMTKTVESPIELSSTGQENNETRKINCNSLASNIVTLCAQKECESTSIANKFSEIEKLSDSINKPSTDKETEVKNSDLDCRGLGEKKENSNSVEADSAPNEMRKLPQLTNSIFDLPECQNSSNSTKCKTRTVNTKYFSTGEKVVNSEESISRSSSGYTVEFPFEKNTVETNEIRKTEQDLPENGGLSRNTSAALGNKGQKTRLTENVHANNQSDKNFRHNNLEPGIKEGDLSRIFEEMSCVRLLSPIREFELESTRERRNEVNEKRFSLSDLPPTVAPVNVFNMDLRRKRTYSPSESCKSKKIKAVNVKARKVESETCNYLDSIMTAMSKQNMELKQCIFNKSSLPDENKEDKTFALSSTGRASNIRKSDSEVEPWNSKTVRDEWKPEAEPPTSPNWCQTEVSRDKTFVSERILKSVIQKFVSSSFTSTEEAEKSVKNSISVLSNGSDEMIARIIVGMVFENVNEEVQVRERPVPPLTNTQYHLIILLSIFKAHDPKRENIMLIIQSKISEKLFPDNFYWPDDALETVCRFYVAICRNRNDTLTSWKFCVQAMTTMRQRCCIVVFVALSTWPDILHKASALKDNILPLTVVNIFLHMPNESRNENQKKKLLGLKHMLREFYEFEIEHTIEKYAANLLDLFYNSETAVEKALILLHTCRTAEWSQKHILSNLCSKLNERPNDLLGARILGVLKELVSQFSVRNKCLARDVITCLTGLLNSNMLNHESEVKVIEVLLGMKQHKTARKIINEWTPKQAISESMKMEIINMASLDILRELKQNPGKEQFARNDTSRRARQVWNKNLKGKMGKKKNQKKKNKGNTKMKGKLLGPGTVL
ncbi:hypothetical protein RUM43_010356 [Polyplax serrata]|uniref:Uncharacterized protein n=1 Tax=Polyplax serrata TaxID=468196 RepID=A0AAN8P401_POLSC